MIVVEDDDIFYFDECKHKWIEACLLKVLINSDWDIPKDSIVPLRLLAEYWRIDTGFSEKIWRALLEAMEVVAGASFKLSTTCYFDSSDKPLAKKRGTTSPQELSQIGYTSKLPSNNEEDLVVMSVVLPSIPITNRFTLLEEKAVPRSEHLAVIVVVRFAFGLSIESAFMVMKEASPTWPVLLVKKSVDKLEAVKIALHKELSTWLSLSDSSTRYPLIKLYHWNLVFSSSEPGMHLVIFRLNPLFTKHTKRWLLAYRFYALQLLQDCKKLDSKWSFIEQLLMRSQYERQIAHHE